MTQIILIPISNQKMNNMKNLYKKMALSIMVLSIHQACFAQEDSIPGIKVAIPFQYEEAYSYENGMACVKSNGKYGVIDMAGNVIVPFNYSNGLFFHDGLARVEEKGKYGYIDLSGNLVIPCKYDDAERDFEDSVSHVVINDKHGLIDTRGNVVLPLEYADLNRSENGVFWARKNDKIGFVNKFGKEFIPCIYYDASTPSEGLICAIKNEPSRKVMGYIDMNGQQVIPFIYDADIYAAEMSMYRYLFSDGKAWVKQNGKWKCINKQGEVILSTSYDDVNPFSKSGIAIVVRNMGWEGIPKYGAINAKGEQIVPCNNDFAYAVGDGLVTTEDGFDSGRDFWRIIYDINGQMIFSYAKAKTLSSYDENEAVVEIGPHYIGEGLISDCHEKKWGLIDKSGALIVPYIFENINDFRHGYAKVKQNGAYGLINRNKELVIPCRYEDLGEYINCGMIDAKQNGKWGYLSIDSTSIEKISLQEELPEISDQCVSDSIYDDKSVDIPPSFIGGEDALKKYYSENLKYPEIARENGEQGRVWISFVVEKDGEITNVEVYRSVTPSLDKAAKKLIMNMPNWIPGQKDGQNVRTATKLPVSFVITGVKN